MILLKIMEWSSGLTLSSISKETTEMTMGVIYHQKKEVLEAVNTAWNF